MAAVHPVVRAFGKGFETQLYLAPDEAASQILKLAVGQTRDVVGHNGLKKLLGRRRRAKFVSLSKRLASALTSMQSCR